MTDHELLEIVFNLNRKRNVSFVKDEKNDRVYSGYVNNNAGIVCRLNISFTSVFPLQLPEIKVVEYDKRFAHMGSDGKICLFDNGSILLKSTMPDQILIDCYDRALDILSMDVNSDEYKKEILREFDSYWLANTTLKMYSTIDEKNYGYCEMPMFVSRKIHVIAASLSDAKYFGCNYLNAIDDDKAFSAKCMVISLRKNSKPIGLKKTYKWIEIRRYILENVSGSVKREFQKFLNKCTSDYMKYIVLSLLGEYGNVMFGFRVYFSNRKKEKIEKITTAKIEQVYIHRMDKSYMLQRSGADIDISNKHVLLLGCGSVGGYIANNLCQLGIGSIDLLDDDFFYKENVHRHFLGFDSLRGSVRYKTSLLKKRLEQMYPYADIDSLDYKDRSAETFIQNKQRLQNYDLIISALGEPTLNLEINRILYEEKMMTPFVCCFNEPYGIGGHAIVANVRTGSCLRCLYTDAISSDLVPFRASFVKENQYFKKNISGCSSAFVPYSCLDSQQTAIITSRLALDVLKGKLEHNEVRSWIGDDENLKNAGFISSDFYENRKIGGTTEKIIIPAAKHCPVCQR